jgi:peroxiredoxin
MPNAQVSLRNLLAALVLVLGLIGCNPSANSVSDQDVASKSDQSAVVAAGSLAADFKLQDLGGNTVSLRSMRGKVIFLNIWATWCGPCREEMPSMETLFQDLKHNPDFVVLAVSVDRKGKAVVAPYVEKNGFHFTVLLDPDNQISESYNVSGVPESFIIDRKGRIVAHHMGAFDWSRSDVKDALIALIDAKDV